jgi:plasmid maintenance system antidote protein VapI
MNWILKKKINEQFGTQGDFAHALRCHESKVSQVVKGRRALSEEEKKQWAELLKADPTYLFQK